MNCIRCTRTAGRFLRYAFAIALMFTALSASAASVFFLDQSNRLPDGINYLSVSLTEIEGGVKVSVDTLDPLNSIAVNHFGIQKFGFGFSSSGSYEITGLPDYWRVKEDRRMSEFGIFDIRLQGRGKARTDSLNFTVNGAGLGDFGSLFSAQVAGFEWCRTDERRGLCSGKNCVSSAYFGGGTPAAVPLPAAAWLFGSGLVGLAGIVRRRRHLS